MSPPPTRVRPVADWLLAASLPVRIVADAAWGVRLPAGVTLAQAAGGLVLATLGPVAAAGLREASTRTWGLFALVAALLGVGAWRADGPVTALTNGLHLAGPFLSWAAGRRVAAPELVRFWLRAAWIPVLGSAAALASGQFGTIVLNGWPRLLGFYGNVHSHAVAMAVFAAAATLAFARKRRGEDLALAIASAAFLVATGVRGPLVFVVVAVLVGAGSSRAVRGGVVLAAALSALVVASRWSDVRSVVTFTAPPGGWGALGSHRLDIWAGSVEAFVRGPVLDQLLGRGLGGQFGLHRHLDPHHEVLSLWFQLGPLGPIAWLAAGVGAAWAARGPHAPAARGLLAGAAFLALLGNDVLYRPTLVLWVAGFAGLCVPRPAPPEVPSRAERVGPGQGTARGAQGPGEAADRREDQRGDGPTHAVTGREV